MSIRFFFSFLFFWLYNPKGTQFIWQVPEVLTSFLPIGVSIQACITLIRGYTKFYCISRLDHFANTRLLWLWMQDGYQFPPHKLNLPLCQPIHTTPSPSLTWLFFKSGNGYWINVNVWLSRINPANWSTCFEPSRPDPLHPRGDEGTQCPRNILPKAQRCQIYAQSRHWLLRPRLPKPTHCQCRKLLCV